MNRSRSRYLRPAAFVFASAMTAVAFAGCGDGAVGAPGADRPDNTGAACTAATDCYPGLDSTGIDGTVTCIDRLPGGYCSHTCNADTDCCAAAGECDARIHEVCSPLESENQTLCFLSCEKDDLFPAEGEGGEVDEQEFCQREAGSSFLCRSSGGGHDNRKICVPGTCGLGAACGDDGDCDSGLACNTAFDGGYCGAHTCASDKDCSGDARCVRHTDGNDYCFKSCKGDGDCSFCRGDAAFSCTDAVDFVEGKSGRVCAP